MSMGDFNSFVNKSVGLPDDDSDLSPGQRARRYPSGARGPFQAGDQTPPLGAGYQQEPTRPATTSPSAAPPAKPGISSRMADLQTPTPPKLNNDYEAAQARFRELSAPTDKYIPGTNKVKPEYRMGIGGRVVGTIGNFLSGFGGSHSPATYVGPGATNRAYDIAEQQRQDAPGKAQADVKSYEDTYKQQERDYRNALKAYDDELTRSNQPPVAQPATTSAALPPAVNGAGQMQPTQTSAQEGLYRFNQPLIAQSAAPAPAATNAGQKQPSQKFVTRARILALSRQHNVPFPDAVKQFQDKGYLIT